MKRKLSVSGSHSIRRVRAAAIFAASILAVTGCSGGPAPAATSGNISEETEAVVSAAESTDSPAPAQDEETNDLTALEATRLMGNGINLGNTMEAYNHKAYLNGADPTSGEGIWGMPHTTREMIAGMKAAGFDTLRVPVAWTNGMNFESGDYTIDERLFARVEEIVNYALDEDMYVVINDHWDGSWWGMFGSKTAETRERQWRCTSRCGRR